MSRPQLPQLDFYHIGPSPPLGFDCGRAEQNDFLHNLACTYHEIGAARTYLAYHRDECVGFVTVSNDAIELSQKERPEGVAIPRLPALKVAQLGVERSWQGRGVGRELVALALAVARLVRSQAGCVYLSVDAKPDVVSFYEKQGFKRNKVEIGRRRQREGDRYDEATAPVSMRFDIREPGEQ